MRLTPSAWKKLQLLPIMYYCDGTAIGECCRTMKKAKDSSTKTQERRRSLGFRAPKSKTFFAASDKFPAAGAECRHSAIPNDTIDTATLS